MDLGKRSEYAVFIRRMAHETLLHMRDVESIDGEFLKLMVMLLVME
ncbi:MAG: hypothetical protein CM15mP49_10550 [Actinomycetota bacterium]|nr:MAG: hypothetical protein CM15mP49_10550 [Actinomycetota bacterium]